jgi:hypothetical protein
LHLLDSVLALPFPVIEDVPGEELGEDWRRFFKQIDTGAKLCQPFFIASNVYRGRSA